MHAGNIGFAGAWEPLLAAAAALADSDVQLVFAGEGASRESLISAAAPHGNVTFVDPVSASDLPALLAHGDLQIVTVRSGLSGLVVPSKLYPLLFAGRPILAVAPDDSDVSMIVREHGCGWAVDPSDVRGLVTAIREAMSDHDELAARGRRAEAAAPLFDRDTLLQRYVREVERVLDTGAVA